MSHFLSEISGMKSNWLIVTPNKVILIMKTKFEAGSDNFIVLETEATVLFG